MLKRIADRIERIATSDKWFPVFVLIAALIALSAAWQAATAVPEPAPCEQCGRPAVWHRHGMTRCARCIPDDL